MLRTRSQAVKYLSQRNEGGGIVVLSTHADIDLEAATVLDISDYSLKKIERGAA